MLQGHFARITQQDLPVIVVRSTAGRAFSPLTPFNAPRPIIKDIYDAAFGKYSRPINATHTPKITTARYPHGASYICAPKIYQAALNAPVVVVAVEAPTGSAAIYWSLFIVFWDDTGGC